MCLTSADVPAGQIISCVIASEYLTVSEAMAECMAASGVVRPELVTQSRALSAAVRRDAPPDLAIVDFDLPGLGALPGVARLCEEAQSTRFVILTDGSLRYTAARLIGVGCAAVVPRDGPSSRLASALKLVLAGEVFGPRDVLPELVGSGRLRGQGALSQSELSVLRCLCEGRTNAEIAGQVGMTVLSVQSVVRTICGRLGASNRTQAALIALTAGLV